VRELRDWPGKKARRARERSKAEERGRERSVTTLRCACALLHSTHSHDHNPFSANSFHWTRTQSIHFRLGSLRVSVLCCVYKLVKS